MYIGKGFSSVIYRTSPNSFLGNYSFLNLKLFAEMRCHSSVILVSSEHSILEEYVLSDPYVVVHLFN